MGNNVAFLSAIVASVRDHFVLNENQAPKASTAVELRDMREVSHPVFTRDEIHEMLEHVCIH